MAVRRGRIANDCRNDLHGGEKRVLVGEGGFTVKSEGAGCHTASVVFKQVTH